MKSLLVIGFFLLACQPLAFATYDKHMISIQEMRSGVYESQSYLTNDNACLEKFEIDKEQWTVRTRPVHNPITGQYCVFVDDFDRRTFYKCTYDECFSSKDPGEKLFFIDKNTILSSKHRVANYFSFFRTTKEREPTVFSHPRNWTYIEVKVPWEKRDDHVFIEQLKEKTISELQGPLRERVEKDTIDACGKYHPIQSCVISESSREKVSVTTGSYAYDAGVSSLRIWISWRSVIKL